ncbi:MAG TPA: BTAD domain-containing putative transcriptional regulator, partial [Chloroflexota bacterium]|nr:BTAD domain-containing putative transcriptional regulator [Chloroflexota bacterium]
RRWDALYLCRAWRAEMLALLGRGDEAVAMVVELFDQFNRQPRPAELRVRLEKEACYTLGFAGRLREAIARGQYVLDHLRQVRRVEERQQIAATVHNVMGICQRSLGDIAAAERHFIAGERLWGQLGNVAQQAGLLNNLAKVRARSGRHREADQAFQAGIDLAESIGHLPAQVTLRASLARAQRERGDLLAAQETMECCLPLARQIDEAWMLGEALLEAGSIALESGKVVEATRFLEAGSDEAQQTRPAVMAVCQALLALAFARSGRLGEAREALALARKGVPQVRAPDERLRGSVAILAAEVALNGDALADLRAVRRWARDTGLQGAFFAECARYRESARLLLNERRLPDDVASGLRATLAEDRLPAPTPAPAPILRPVPRQAPETAFEIRLLGTPGLLRDGENVSSWRTNLVRELLFFLAFRAGDVVRSEALVDALIPEGEFERSLTALRHAVYHLRRLFAPLNPVRTATGGYCLELDGEVRCDVQEFRRLVEAGRPGRAGVDVAALEGALSLYRGSFLEGVDADWVAQPRAELERLFLLAARSLLQEYERTESHEAAVAVAERVLVIDPFLEPFHLALLRHQVALGHLAAARQHYRHYCR